MKPVGKTETRESLRSTEGDMISGEAVGTFTSASDRVIAGTCQDGAFVGMFTSASMPAFSAETPIENPGRKWSSGS